MIPTSFDESNNALSPPDDMTADECSSLSVWQGDAPIGERDATIPVTISCWKLTKDELDLINQTGRVWLTVYGGGMPPVSLQIENPFE